MPYIEVAAFGARPLYLIGVEANWEDRDAADENVAWSRGTVDDLRNFERLVSLRREYDPSGLFG